MERNEETKDGTRELLLISRMSGTLTLRLILQPTIASILGIRPGLKDAREGHPICGPPSLIRLTGEACCKKAVSKVLVIALVLDSVYQYIVFHWFYQVEALIVALTLAILPYVLIHGPLNRTARRWLKTKY